MDKTAEALHALARAHLPADVAERWTGLLRPGIRLTAAAGSDPVAARLGGSPELPETMEWPVWEGHGPLSFVGSIDCAELPSGALDPAMPSRGTLEFFYFDGQLDGGEALVLAMEPGTSEGAQVLYVPAGTAVSARKTPADLDPYPEVQLTAQVEMTAPDPYHPLVEQEFALQGRPSSEVHDHPVHGDDFLEALWDLAGDEPEHRVGGHADPVQQPVEFEVAHPALGGRLSWEDPALAAEALGWTLLAQFDTDGAADMMWGDCGVLYWLIRPADLAALRFDRAMFTWQCG
ncbi:DUF1963 domain-containing protein [Streptomyces sp. N2-109]|uniref:DUF1963 domain-containing protein n=1 Tax=Streptomyces gossypii TaxID=2883101 RepID=A0ABT2JYU7_9ACTN|nr:YwqG family protein [Streptomyces gossypii]MCT2593076.1 DUF1963 domain-containing protein [Streptomyces gossypii]